MTPTDLDSLLAQLGQAHRDGALAPSAAAYPWRADRRSSASRSAAHAGHRWVRVAIPLAAAAAVAVLFVLPGLFGTRSVREMAHDGPAGVNPETANLFADAEPAATQGRSPDCDYNGDGVIDGRDIQALIDRLRDSDEDPALKAEKLQRCLLGS
ncbi:MAG TPA: hypothetical protein VJZ71_19615 [Phycisphaerae bacterium]|nr:hypothetical protein [Phycisphaerae bacterium]